MAWRGQKTHGQSGVVGERRGLWPALTGPGIVWLLLLFVTPFYAIFAIAGGQPDPIFNQAQPEWNPLRWDPTAVRDVFADFTQGQLGRIFLRTLTYVVVASSLCLLIGYPVAYYLARHAGRWKTIALVLVIAPFWINYLMRMLAWVNLLDTDGYINRILMALRIIDLPRQWLAGHHEVVILGLVYGYIPFLILPLYAALDRIDQSLIAAARDLGATPRQAFLRVTLPLSKQGIMAGLVIVMLPMFGDYYTPNLLSGQPRTRMVANEIDLYINSGVGGATGAALTLYLMALVAVLMVYYLVTVARGTREARS